MPEIESTVQNYPSQNTLCELTLWPPSQGAIAEVIPLDIDLDFSSDTVEFVDGKYQIYLKRATIHLKLINAELARGSELGRFVFDPEMTMNVTQDVRNALETESGYETGVQVEVTPNALGKLFGLIRKRKSKKRKHEESKILKASLRLARISPVPANRWVIVEPIAPFLLNGRFAGSDGQKEVGPLCIISMPGSECSANIVVSADRNDLSIGRTGGSKPTTRNKQCVIDQLIRKSVKREQVNQLTVPPNLSSDDIILSYSALDVKR